MKPPRKILLYSDARGRCEVLKVMRELDERSRDRISDRLKHLEKYEWEYLFKSGATKELVPGVYELRPKGIRMTFFLTTCRGENEAIITDCEKRGDLSGLLWRTFIQRALRLREEWMRRNCK